MSLPDGDIPFAAILRPWLRGRHGDGWLTATGDGPVTPEARADLERGLLIRLADLAAPVLLRLFDAGRKPVPPAARLTARTPASAPCDAHRRFVADVDAEGLDRVLAAWPVLLDRLQAMADAGRAARRDFIRHATADPAALSRLVPGWRAGMPAIVGVQFGLSDPHGGGRSVGRIRFADGTSLAYKPRSLAVDAGFSGLLRALSDAGGAPEQRIPLVVDRGDHGWMEWIDAAPMRRAGEAVAFYRRCGGLLAVMTMLRGGDIHPDNMVAAGAFPVILDLECLFQPGSADLGMSDPLLDPVAFQTGILPVFTSFDGGRSLVPLAAAGAGAAPQRPQRRIVHAGTDWMHEAEWPVPANDLPGPCLGASPLDVRDFADAVADGFRRTLRVMAQCQAAWARPGQPLYRLAHAPVRFLAAPTNLYALILEHVRRPEMLADPVVWQAVLTAETAALDRLDVPAFRYHPTGRRLREADGGPVGALPGRSMAAQVTAGLAGLDAAGIRARTALIAASLRRPAPPGKAPHGIDARGALVRLTDRIADLAVPAGRGAEWVRMWEQIPALVAPAGPGLCYGAGGIAVTLAAAARTLGDERLAALARRALVPWTGRRLRPQAPDLAARIGAGWGRGIGGMIAALVWCAERLEWPTLLDDAMALAMATKAALRVAPDVPDMLEGAAGLVLGLSVLYQARPHPTVLAAMRDAGRHILRRSRLSGEWRDWPDRGRPGLAGLSHGAGGIAVALAHLARLDGRRGPWTAAIRQALAYEDSLYDPGPANWRNLGGHPPFKSTWCHGAPGIALARQAVGEMLPDLALSPDAAIATTRRTPITDSDDLCCGEGGRLDILLTLAARRQDAALAAEVGQILATRLPDWAAGRVRLMAVQAGAPDDPSLLRGLGGLAHLLVRHLAPDHAADVLLPFSPWTMP